MTEKNEILSHKGVIIQRCADYMLRVGKRDNPATYAKPILDMLYTLADERLAATDETYARGDTLDRHKRVMMDAGIFIEGARMLHYGVPFNDE